VVSIDATANTITVRNPGAGSTHTETTATESHDNLTLPVEGKATASLKDIKAGDRVMISCREGAAAPAGSSASGTVSGSGSATGMKSGDTVTGSSSVTTKSGDTVTGKGSATAGDTVSGKSSATAAGDSGWSMAKAGRCAAVTDIAKSRASSKTESQPDASTKSDAQVDSSTKKY